MASIYAKGGWLYARLKGIKEAGKWGAKQTKFREGQEAEALRYAVAAQRVLDQKHDVAQRSPQTVAEYAERWLEERKLRGIASWTDDHGRLHNHVLPVLGHLKLEDVRPRHIRDLVRALRAKDGTPERLAPRTIINIHGVMSTMFRDAVVEELIPANPCVLKHGELPEKVDKDPEWRDKATYLVEEVLALITDKRIPVERRVQYALKALAGLRHGEVAGLRFRHWEPGMQPLGRLVIATSYTKGRTKTNVVRHHPVHPLLARILTIWREVHWARIYEREPTPDDFIVPARTMRPVNKHTAGKNLKYDLGKTLELRLDAGEERDRGGHDLRAWFITTAQEHGARREDIERITHTKKKDVVSGYSRSQWPQLCGAVAKLRIAFDGDPLELATGLLPRERNSQNRWLKRATPTGFEPGISSAKRSETDASGRNAEPLATDHDVSRTALVTNRVTED